MTEATRLWTVHGVEVIVIWECLVREIFHLYLFRNAYISNSKTLGTMLHIRRRLPSSLVLKYYVYKATVTFGFFWPIFTLFLLHRNLTYAQIGTLGSISAAITIVGEIPTGYVADRIGRRKMLAIGSALLAISVLGFVVATTFLAFAVLYLIWALGLAFQSGSEDAWLYDMLKDRLREDEFTRIRGRGGSVSQWISAGSMLLSGGLYSIDPRLPFLIGGVVISLSVPISLSFPRNELADVEEEMLTIRQTVAAMRDTLLKPPLRSFILYMAVFFGIIQSADKFIQPIAVHTLALPEVGLGPLYAGFSVVAAISSYYADDIRRLLTRRWAFVVIPALTAVFFVFPLLVPLAAFPMFFVMKATKEAMSPIASGYLNDHVDSLGRATLLSGVAMAYSLVQLVLKPVSGMVADVTSPIEAVAALGGFFIVSSLAIYALRLAGQPKRGVVPKRSD